MDLRDPRLATAAATAMAAARVTIGLSTVLRPDRLARSWLGASAEGTDARPAVQVLGRGHGGRDLMLGAGALAALAARDRAAGAWLAAGGVADAVDGVTTVLLWRSLPSRSRWVFAASAAGTAVASGLICAGLRPR